MIAIDTNLLVYAHRVKKLWTADRDFSSFPEMACENPLVKRGK